jgi:DNA-binding ferritin-like protein
MFLKQCQDFIDFLFCSTADFYMLHHSICGPEFDILHSIFERYYVEALEDFDQLSEWLVGFSGLPQPPAQAAQRIDYPVFEVKEHIYKKEAVETASILMQQIVKGYHILSSGITNDDAVGGTQIGFQSWMHDRIKYWSKELLYFNQRRKDEVSLSSSIEESQMNEENTDEHVQ